MERTPTRGSGGFESCRLMSSHRDRGLLDRNGTAPAHRRIHCVSLKRESVVLALLTASLVPAACGSSSRRLQAEATTSPTTSTRHVAAAVPRNAVFVATFPQIGTVYSRYECDRFTLGIRLIHLTQTTLVRFRAGSVSHVRTVQPGETTWFRYSRNRVQWLGAVASGEDGAVVGWARVVGYPRSSRRGNCDAYDPPRVTVQIYPRSYDVPRDVLGRLIG